MQLRLFGGSEPEGGRRPRRERIRGVLRVNRNDQPNQQQPQQQRLMANGQHATWFQGMFALFCTEHPSVTIGQCATSIYLFIIIYCYLLT